MPRPVWRWPVDWLACTPIPPPRPEFRELAAGIEADRDALAALLERQGSTRAHTKEAMGWTTEKLTRLKLRVQRHRPDLDRLIALETLSLGIAGKVALWHALEATFDTACSEAPDLRLLAWRAQRQHAIVEQHRLDEARRVLSLSSLPS